MAANGMCVRGATGVRANATATQATRAPVATPTPSCVIAAHRKAWANMPTPTGHGSILSGVEKYAVCGNSNAGGNDVLPQGDGSASRVGQQGYAEQPQPKEQSYRDRDDDQPGINQAGGAKRYAAVDEVERAIEKMRTGHEHHARADRDEAQR